MTGLLNWGTHEAAGAGVQAMKPATTIQQATETHDAANLRYARIVAANLNQYGPAHIRTAGYTFRRLKRWDELEALERRTGMTWR